MLGEIYMLGEVDMLGEIYMLVKADMMGKYMGLFL